MKTDAQSVLVTGASSGIGLATAQLLSQSGFRVFAGVRRFSDGRDFEEVLLDVTKPESVAEALAEIESKPGGLFALVNNAGVGDIIPLEHTPLERFKAVFDVNVHGVVAVTQAFLPLLRASGGRIVNIGSIGGMITIPFGSSLCATKHAIEAVSDAMRLELYSSGIHVSLIQPASINSGSAEKLAATMEQTIASLPAEGRARYEGMLRSFNKKMLAQETAGSPPSVVAGAVLDALRAKSPPARRIVGKDGKLLHRLARSMPDFVRDRLFLRFLLGNPKFGGN